MGKEKSSLHGPSVRGGRFFNFFFNLEGKFIILQELHQIKRHNWAK